MDDAQRQQHRGNHRRAVAVFFGGAVAQPHNGGGIVKQSQQIHGVCFPIRFRVLAIFGHRWQPETFRLPDGTAARYAIQAA